MKPLEINIAAFRAEFVRHAGMTVYERVNDNAKKAKTQHRRRLAVLAKEQPSRKQYSLYRGWLDGDRRISAFWWAAEPERWDGRTKAATNRPTEDAAFQGVFDEALLMSKDFNLLRYRLAERLIMSNDKVDWKRVLSLKMSVQMALAI